MFASSAHYLFHVPWYTLLVNIPYALDTLIVCAVHVSSYSTCGRDTLTNGFQINNMWTVVVLPATRPLDRTNIIITPCLILVVTLA
jgi:Rieske Fe-S protein